MSTSGTFITDPNLADFADEAFERAGILPAAITADHIASFRRSVGFVLSSWANDGPRQWKFDVLEHTVTQGEVVFELPAGTIDVRSVTLLRGDRETEMVPMSRTEYHVIHNKLVEGRPSSYFVDRRRDTAVGSGLPDPGAVRLQLFYWQAAENDTDVIRVLYFSQIEDAASPGMSRTFDMPFRFHEAFAAALAARVAQKFKPERYADLFALAGGEYKRALDGDAEMSPLFVTVDYTGRYGRR